MTPVSTSFEVAFNHDGFGMLVELAESGMTEDDASRVLVDPLKGSAVTVIDWSIMTTGQHNCRTRHRRGFVGDGQGREIDRLIGKVVSHYNARPNDLLDIVIERGHAAGMRVFGSLRLNHGALNAQRLLSCPGRNAGQKKDFRDPAFHAYLCELVEDVLGKGVDGVSLDFERKAPFYPDEASEVERMRACEGFLGRVRALTDKPILVRVSHESKKGAPQGQDPEQWIRDGLVDVVVPATHNHEPDSLDWSFDRFLVAASRSSRPCMVWPQIWPTPAPWTERDDRLHAPEAVAKRVNDIRAQGAHGVYFFNFCCFGSQSRYIPMFRRMAHRPEANKTDAGDA
jgi:hypothetical protein